MADAIEALVLEGTPDAHLVDRIELVRPLPRPVGPGIEGPLIVAGRMQRHAHAIPAIARFAIDEAERVLQILGEILGQLVFGCRHLFGRLGIGTE